MKPRKVRARVAITGLGLSLALGGSTPAPAAAQASPAPAPSGAPIIYQKARSFRVPFHFDPAERIKRRELQLWVSDDQGRNWKQQGVTTPDHPAFSFNTDHDGEFWLAVRSVDIQGRLFPADDARIVPNMRVVVDTTPPSIVLEPKVRSASLASVRWEIRDQNPDDAHPPTVQYQVEGGQEWLPISLDENGLAGVATWDSGATESLKVRATTIDRAGNKAETILTLAANTPGAGPLASIKPTPVPAAAPVPTSASASAPAPASASAPALAPKVSPTVDQSLARQPGGDSGSAPVNAPLKGDEAALLSAARLPGAEGTGPVEAPPAPVESRAQALPVSQQPGQQEHRVVEGAGGMTYASAQDVGTSAQTAPAALESPPIVALPPGGPNGTPPFANQITTTPPKPVFLEAEPTAGEVGERQNAAAMAASGTRAVPGELPSGVLNQAVPPATASKEREPRTPGADPGVGMAGLINPTEPTRTPEAEVPPVAPAAKLKVPGPRFLLDYAVDRAGPEGRPTVVEYWFTRDSGKTWSRGGADPDRVSPILVELAGEGTYGISLIARDASGNGDKSPVPGDEPKMWVEVGPAPQPQPADRAPSLLQRAFRR